MSCFAECTRVNWILSHAGGQIIKSDNDMTLRAGHPSSVTGPQSISPVPTSRLTTTSENVLLQFGQKWRTWNQDAKHDRQKECPHDAMVTTSAGDDAKSTHIVQSRGWGVQDDGDKAVLSFRLHVSLSGLNRRLGPSTCDDASRSEGNTQSVWTDDGVQ